MPAHDWTRIDAGVFHSFRVDVYAEPLGVGAPPLPDVPLFFDPGHYVNVPMAATYDAAWQATPRRWRDVVAPPA